MAPMGKVPDVASAAVASGTTLSPVIEMALALALRSVPRSAGTADGIG